MKRWWILVCGLALCAAGGCERSRSDRGGGASERPIEAVVTVGMVADLVRHVGGDRVQVTALMGSGVDPHLYKATRDDVQQIMQCDLVFYSGLMLEGKMTDTLIRVSRSKPVYAVTEAIEPSRLLEPAEFSGHHDPHVWMDVAAWAHGIDTVTEALAEYDPSGADHYHRNAAKYREQLRELDEYARRVLATIPPESRVLITSHDAFNYLGRAYELEVMGVQGLSTESEAGLQRINELVDLLVEREIAAVFVESSVPRKNIAALVDGAAARGHEVTVAGELYSDAMGEPGTYEGTYTGMIDHNVTLIARSLGGDAPAGGLHGKLTW